MTDAPTRWPIHGRIGGPIVMIGFGSIGRGTLPLIERHFEYDKARFTVIDPVDTTRRSPKSTGCASRPSRSRPRTTARCSPRSSPRAAARASA